MTRQEIDLAIERAVNAESVFVPMAHYSEIVDLACIGTASAKLIARSYNEAERLERDGERYVSVDAGLYIDLLTAAKRAMGPRAV